MSSGFQIQGTQLIVATTINNDERKVLCQAAMGENIDD